MNKLCNQLSGICDICEKTHRYLSKIKAPLDTTKISMLLHYASTMLGQHVSMLLNEIEDHDIRHQASPGCQRNKIGQMEELRLAPSVTDKGTPSLTPHGDDELSYGERR